MTTKKEIVNDLFEFIGELNNNKYQHIPEEDPLPAVEVNTFEICTDGDVIIVKFMGHLLWDTEEWTSDEDTIEDIKNCIIEETLLVLEGIQNIHINLYAGC